MDSEFYISETQVRGLVAESPLVNSCGCVPADAGAGEARLKVLGETGPVAALGATTESSVDMFRKSERKSQT